MSKDQIKEIIQHYDLKNRGVEDVFIAAVDGLNGFQEAIEAAYPKTGDSALYRPSNQEYVPVRDAKRQESVLCWLERGVYRAH